MFAAFGVEAEPTLAYAEARLGEVMVRPGQGHDGKFFFVQANDPWILDPDNNASVLDLPIYRSQRMLYPAVAGLGGLATAETIVWGMLVVNLVAIGLGTWVVAEIALEMGASVWWGLSFALNLGVLGELVIDGAGIMSLLFAFLAVLMVLKGRTGLSVASLVFAGLSREVMLITAVGIGFWLWRNARIRQAVLAIVVPITAVGGWALYLRVRIDESLASTTADALGIPFQGVIEAFSRWVESPVDLAVGIATLALLAVFAVRALMNDHVIGWAFVGFVPLAALLSVVVWTSWFDISRAMIPVLPAYALLLFARTPQSQLTPVPQ